MPTIDHRLPVRATDQTAIHDNSRAIAARLQSGELPDYPLFVELLFKKLPLIPHSAVMDALANSVDPADGTLDVDTFQAKLNHSAGDPCWTALHAAVGCAGEGGELLDVVKKVAMYGKGWHDENEDGVPLLHHLLEELGDLRFYYQKLLNMLGITDTMVQDWNMAKLSKRYASGAYSDAEAKARADKRGRNYLGQERPK